VVVLLVVLSLGAAGLLAGPGGLVVFVLAWVVVPSSSRLAQRLAINGSVALAVIPLLWWVAWPVVGGLTHGVVAIALAVAGSAAVAHRRGWRRLIPRPVVVDVLIPVALAACAFLLLPLLSGAGRGSSAMGILLQVTAGDNAEHFHMFEATRRLGVSGFGWGPDAPHGGGVPFASYPQHFHSFTVFLSQLGGGAAVGSIEHEAGLYLAASTATLLFALATAVAAIVSHGRLRRHPGVAVVVVAAAVSILFYGFGATSIQYGFAPFHLAVLAAITVIALVAGSGRMTLPALAAVMGGALVVGFTWTLAVTLVVPALIGALLLLPRARDRPLPERLGAALCVLGLVAGGLVEVIAGFASISGVGAGGALALSGSVAAAPVPDAIVVTVAAVAVSVVALRRRAGALPRRPRVAGPLAIGGAGVVGLVQFLALLLLSLALSGGVAYYPIKFLDAMYLVMTPIAVLAAASLLVTLRVALPRAVSGLVAFVATIAVLLYSGTPSDSFGQPIAAGMRLRVDLETASGSLSPASERILAAATSMQTLPCAQPTFLAPFPDDKPVLNGDQWALSLSGTWSNDDGPLNAYLQRVGVHGNAAVSPSAVVRHLLAGHPGRCVLAVPAVIDDLDAAVRDEFGSQLFPLAAP
jgi:hypothetical protein